MGNGQCKGPQVRADDVCNRQQRGSYRVQGKRGSIIGDEVRLVLGTGPWRALYANVCLNSGKNWKPTQ